MRTYFKNNGLTKQFIKAASIVIAFIAVIVSLGTAKAAAVSHYDEDMDDIFFCYGGTSAPTYTADQDKVYEKLTAMKSSYPEGMRWTNENFYEWNGGGYFYGGYGCAGFAFLLSDAAFGDAEERTYYNVTIGSLRVGDIVRMYGDTHSAIVLTVSSDRITIAEGNYNSSIHWGRTIKKEEITKFTYFMTRYADDPVMPPVKLINGSAYCIEDDFIFGVQPNTSLAAFRKQFINDVVIWDNTGGKPYSGNIGSGFSVSSGEEEYYWIVIKGDTDGNGVIDSTDYITIKNFLLNIVVAYPSSFSNSFRKAADLNESGDIDVTDCILLKRYMLGISDRL